jgi:hypothetical protein
VKYMPKTTKRLGDGCQFLYELSNGYGASVVTHSGAYGGRELAVIEWDDKHADGWNIVYDVPGAPDVIGWLTEDDVQAKLGELDKFQGVRGRCEIKMSSCSGHGRRTHNPYTLEINGERAMQYICKNCHGELLMEI